MGVGSGSRGGGGSLMDGGGVWWLLRLPAAPNLAPPLPPLLGVHALLVRPGSLSRHAEGVVGCGEVRLGEIPGCA